MGTPLVQITDGMRESMKAAVRKKRLAGKEVAALVGMNGPWFSKVLKGSIKTIHINMLEKLEVVLDVPLMAKREQGPISDLAARFARLIDEDPAIAKLAEGIMALHDKPALAPTPALEPQCESGIPWLLTKDFVRVGQQIERLVHAEAGKPGKIMREIMAMLTEPEKKIPLNKPWPTKKK